MSCLFRLATSVFAVVALLATMQGCGVPTVKVQGKLTKNGETFKVAKDTLVTLRFIPELAEGEAARPDHSVRFKQETGEYEVEMPAGKYRVSYVIVEKNKTPVTSPPEMKNKSYDLTRSQQLDIELGK